MKPGRSPHGAALLLWRINWLMLVCLILYPINNLLVRLLLIGSLAFVWFGTLILSWRSKLVRSVLATLAVLALVCTLAPGRTENANQLRDKYVGALQSYEGTRYVWGGENWLGVDCSGLLRAALIKICFQEGLRTANPGLIRNALKYWWFDTSAEALGNEYREQTRLLLETASLNKLDHSQIRPGDFAVMGIHVMAYLGNNTWIEADPGAWKVIRIAAGENHPWLTMRSRVMRWRLFETPAAS